MCVFVSRCYDVMPADNLAVLSPSPSAYGLHYPFSLNVVLHLVCVYAPAPTVTSTYALGLLPSRTHLPRLLRRTDSRTLVYPNTTSCRAASYLVARLGYRRNRIFPLNNTFILSRRRRLFTSVRCHITTECVPVPSFSPSPCTSLLFMVLVLVR